MSNTNPVTSTTSSNPSTQPASAKLNKLNIAPRKLHFLLDLIRGKTVNQALAILDFQQKKGTLPIKKLILSAIANWKQNKTNQHDQNHEPKLYILQIYVNSAGILKRIKPAPQGRAHPIKKRSSHTTVVVGEKQQASSTKNLNQPKPTN